MEYEYKIEIPDVLYVPMTLVFQDGYECTLSPKTLKEAIKYFIKNQGEGYKSIFPNKG